MFIIKTMKDPEIVRDLDMQKALRDGEDISLQEPGERPKNPFAAPDIDYDDMDPLA